MRTETWALLWLWSRQVWLTREVKGLGDRQYNPEGGGMAYKGI